MTKAKEEIRTAELRAAPNDTGEMIVEGYAIVWDSPTVLYEIDGIKYREVIKRGALDSADMSDVPFRYNHETVLARTRNKTLQLTIDEKGLFIRASLANTTVGKDLYELIKRGDVDKQSFGFIVKSESYDRSTRTRSVEKIKRLADVSAVDMPAYEQTSISARGYFDLEREKEQALERERQLKIKQLKIKTYL